MSSAPIGAFFYFYTLDKLYAHCYFVNKVKELITMITPKIRYETVILTYETLNKMRTNRSVCSGQTNTRTGEVIIYKFKIDEKMRLPDDLMAALKRDVKILNDSVPETLAHELHHIQNTPHVYYRNANSHYEKMELQVLDEITATAAGYMYAESNPTPNAVARALRDASDAYQTRPYFKTFVDFISDDIDEIIRLGGTEVMILQNVMYETAPEILLRSQNLAQAKRQFFTFGNQSMMYGLNMVQMMRSSDWSAYDANMKKIRKQHMDKLFNVINAKIGRSLND